MRQSANVLRSFTLVAVAGALSSCAIDPVSGPLIAVPSAPLSSGILVEDLRSPAWKKTQLIPNLRGATQHFGDDAASGGLPGYILARVSPELLGIKAQRVQIKTIDVRLTLPDLDVPAKGKYTMNVDQLNYQLTAKSSASAVICLNVDGVDYLGNFATLARIGLQKEMVAAIDNAVGSLKSNLGSRTASKSPACQPGWEGGQPS